MNDDIYDYALGQKLGDPVSKALYMLLASLADRNNFCCPTLIDLSEISEFPLCTVERNLWQLTRRGYIANYGCAGSAKNLYRIIMK